MLSVRGRKIVKTFRTHRARRLNKRQKRQVKTLIGRNIEKKYLDTASIVTTVTSAGTIFPLGMPPAGGGSSQRIGDRIDCASLEFRYVWVGQSADTYNHVRTIVFKWMNDNAVYPPVVGSILTSPGSSVAPEATYTFDNWKAGDFRIVYDKVHSLSWSNASNGIQCVAKVVNLFGKRLHNKRINLNAAATTGDGVYYILVISDAVTNVPSFGFNCRLLYKDA